MASKVATDVRELKRQQRELSKGVLERMVESEKDKAAKAKTPEELEKHTEAAIEARRALGKLESKEKANRRAKSSKARRKGGGAKGLSGTLNGITRALGLK